MHVGLGCAKPVQILNFAMFKISLRKEQSGNHVNLSIMKEKHKICLKLAGRSKVQKVKLPRFKLSNTVLSAHNIKGNQSLKSPYTE